MFIIENSGSKNKTRQYLSKCDLTDRNINFPALEVKTSLSFSVCYPEIPITIGKVETARSFQRLSAGQWDIAINKFSLKHRQSYKSNQSIQQEYSLIWAMHQGKWNAPFHLKRRQKNFKSHFMWQIFQLNAQIVTTLWLDFLVIKYWRNVTVVWGTLFTLLKPLLPYGIYFMV